MDNQIMCRKGTKGIELEAQKRDKFKKIFKDLLHFVQDPSQLM